MYGISMQSELEKLLERIAASLEQQNDPDASLTTEEAGRFLKVSASSILRFKEVGLPFYQTKDHGITFRRSDLINWREQFRTVKNNHLELVVTGKQSRKAVNG